MAALEQLVGTVKDFVSGRDYSGPYLNSFRNTFYAAVVGSSVLLQACGKAREISPTAPDPVPVTATPPTTTVPPDPTPTPPIPIPTDPPRESGDKELFALADNVSFQTFDITLLMRRLIDMMLVKHPSAQIAWDGDLQYDNATKDELERGWKRVYDDLKNRSFVIWGNHDHGPGSDFRNYFADLIQKNRIYRDSGVVSFNNFYALDYGAWRFYILDSNLPTNRNSVQYSFLQHELTTNRTLCTAVFMHHPYQTPGKYFDQQGYLRDIMTLAFDNQVDLVFNGHDHLKWSTKKVDMDGNEHPRGIRTLGNGAGGAPLYTERTRAKFLEWDGGTHGLLHITLRRDGYTYSFLNLNGGVEFSNSDRCH